MPVAARRSTSSRVDLDRPDTYRHLDPRGILGFAVQFADQVAEAAQIGRDFAPPPQLQAPGNAVVAGMGGSAVAGDLLSRLIEKRTPLPFAVCRNYAVPALVGPGTLFIASSFSGNTEETIAAAGHALRRRAKLACITTGGRLAAFARRARVPLISLPRPNPDLPPRSALGYMLLPLVMLFESLGLYPGASRELREAQAVLESLCARMRPEVPTARNPAKQLAKRLLGKIPVVQGTAGIMSAAAYRWRTQFNENSKVLAISSEYPELNHNEVVGWELPKHLARLFEALVLMRPDETPRLQARVAITEAIVRRKARVHLLRAEGRGLLAQLLWAVCLGDFTSIYLAYLNQVDPATIHSIDQLKRRLQEQFNQ